jgi:hypothetical protein
VRWPAWAGALVLIGAAIVVLLVERGRQKRRACTAARRRYNAFVSQPLLTPKVPKPPVVYPTEILPPVIERRPASRRAHLQRGHPDHPPRHRPPGRDRHVPPHRR